MPNEIDIKPFLEEYLRGKKFLYVPNPGNAGDTIIAYATLQMFDEMQLDYEIGNPSGKYNDTLIVYGGGGNLVGLYKACEDFMWRNRKANEIILLPHSIRRVDALVAALNENIKIICREIPSYDYVIQRTHYRDNVFLSHDMAFYLTGMDEYKKQGEGTLFSFRVDAERTLIKRPQGNVDISEKFALPGNTSDREVINKVTHMFFDFISKYDTVDTNRLHVGIVASLLDKNVNLHTNSYYKVKAVYDHSMKDRFPKTIFHERD